MRNLDLDALQIFKAVADEGGVARAAAQLNRVQSNVSTRLKQLEAALDAPLFRRQNRRLVLSDQGRVLLSYADRLLRLSAEAQQAVRDGAARHVAPGHHGKHGGGPVAAGAGGLPRGLAAGAHRAGHGHLGRAGGQGARLRTRSGLRGRALSRRGTGVNRGLRRNAGPDFAARLARDRRRAGAGRSHGDRLRVRLFLSPHPGVLARPRRRGAGQGDGVRVLSRDRRLRGGRYGRGHRAALRAGCAGRADRAAGARPAGQYGAARTRLVWRVDDDTPAVQALRDQLAA